MVVLHGLRQRLETLGDTVPVDYGYVVRWRGGDDVVAKLGLRGDPAWPCFFWQEEPLEVRVHVVQEQERRGEGDLPET
jgi:hypothetical protein